MQELVSSLLAFLLWESNFTVYILNYRRILVSSQAAFKSETFALHTERRRQAGPQGVDPPPPFLKARDGR